MQAVNSTVHLSPLSNIIGALQNILSLASSQVIIPDLETPFSKFSNSDHSFTKLNGQIVNDIITECQQQLDTVLHEIEGLETVMDHIQTLHQQLVEKKDKITQSMNLHKELVPALWRLPTELLSQIFVHCLPQTYFLFFLYPSRLRAPLLLTRICRRWREVAISTPSLWCSLSMRVNAKDWQRAASCHDSWLKQSRGLPLSLALECSGNQSTKLQSLLHPYLNQITHLSTHFLSSADKPELLLTDLPALQELTMIMDDTHTHTTPALTHSMSQLPFTMRSLTVFVRSFDLHHYSFGSVWAHLTNIEIGRIYQPSTVLQILRLCPDLYSLSIFAVFDQIQALGPITHPKLQCLRIHDNSPSNSIICDLFNALTLPNLCSLETSRSDGKPCPHDELKAFFSRSKCSLRVLRFGKQLVAIGWRTEYLDLVHSLTKVMVDREYIAFPLFNHLCYDV